MAYRGSDRRRRDDHAADEPRPATAAVVVGLAAFAAVVGALVVAAGEAEADATLTATRSAAAALVLLAGLVALTRGLWSGNAPPALRGAGLLAAAVGVLGPAALRSHPSTASGAWLFSTTGASLLGGTLLVASVRWADVDTRVRPLLVAGAGIVLALATLAVDAAAIGPVGERTQSAAAAVAWAVAAAVYFVARRPSGEQGAVWPGAAMVALAAGFAVGAAAHELPAETAAFHLVGGAIAAAGASSALLGDAALHRRREVRLRRELADTAARADDSRSVLTAASHDLGNAVTAIVGAAQTISRHVDRLDPATREQLLEGLAAQAARVQHVVASVLDRRAAEEADDPAHGGEVGPVLAGGAESHDD